MAIAFGAQAASSNGTTSQATREVTLSVSAGDLIVVLLAYRDSATFSSVVGSVNGAYTLANSVQELGASAIVAGCYYFQNSAAGTETITVTTGSNARGAVNASRWTGAATSSAFDQHNGANTASAGTAHNPGSVTTTGAGVILTSFCFGGDEGAFTQTGFTALTSDSSGFVRDNFGYRIVTGSTADDGDLSSTNSVVAACKIVSFNEAASALDPIRLVWRQ